MRRILRAATLRGLIPAPDDLLRQASRLKFAEPALEARFHSEHLASSLRQWRFATAFGALGVALIGLNSLLRFDPAQWPVNFMTITRYGLVVPWPLLLLAATWWQRRRHRLELFACILMPAMLACYFLSLAERLPPMPRASDTEGLLFLSAQFSLATAVCLPLHTRAQALMTGVLAPLFPLLLIGARPAVLTDPDAAHLLTSAFITAAFTSVVSTLVAWVRERSQRRWFAQNVQLEAANAELSRLNREKDELMQIAAHDLRGPLAAVRNSTQLLARQALGAPLGPDHQTVLHDVTATSDRMLTLVNSLLDIHAIERGQISVALTDADVSPVLATVRERHRTAAAEKRQTLVLHPSAHPGGARHDPALLAQVLDNLVANALKFSALGSTIHLRLAPSPDAAPGTRLRLSVIDAGPGLSQSDRTRLFQPFARLSARPTAGEPSLGLGLSAARKLTLAMGGEIGAAPAPNGGTEFWIELPASSHAA